MKSRLLNLATAVSLLLCVATLGMWMRSHYRSDSWFYGHGSTQSGTINYTQHALSCKWGEVVYCRLRLENRNMSSGFIDGFLWLSEPAIHFDDPRRSVRLRGNELLGFGYLARQSSTPRPGSPPTIGRYYEVIAPHWGIALLFALLPAARVRSWLRARRRQPGTCPHCGYDLRASPDRCPECGMVCKPASMSEV